MEEIVAPLLALLGPLWGPLAGAGLLLLTQWARKRFPQPTPGPLAPPAPTPGPTPTPGPQFPILQMVLDALRKVRGATEKDPADLSHDFLSAMWEELDRLADLKRRQLADGLAALGGPPAGEPKGAAR